MVGRNWGTKHLSRDIFISLRKQELRTRWKFHSQFDRRKYGLIVSSKNLVTLKFILYDKVKPLPPNDSTQPLTKKICM